jgi:hypothetical protein
MFGTCHMNIIIIFIIMDHNAPVKKVCEQNYRNKN